jgi:NADPH-dependent glutamate synthase beta subunit-like oxidoreductase
MSVSGDEMKTKRTFRRYKDGDNTHVAWNQQIFQASWTHKCPTYVNRTPPCQASCPSGHDIRGWLNIVRGIDKPMEGQDWKEYAFRRAVEANPFPSIMGRVCPAPCEDGCNRNEVDEFVGINSVEQFIGDYALENNLKFEAAADDTGKHIAIVGGGPAGLACAYNLRLMGHACTIFESASELGGMIRYGIPGYRTPREVLDNEIQRIVDMGMEVRLNTKVGVDITLDELERDFDATFWAIGAQSGRAMPIPGGDAPNCISGVAFLNAFNDGRLSHVSGRVVVVGGGDTSIDVASVARRLGKISNVSEKDRVEYVVLGQTAHDVATTAKKEGADVMLISRHKVETMTAAAKEIDDALREGVQIRGGVEPVEVIIGEDGRACALKVRELEIIDGKRVPKEGSEFEIEADLIVSAIGQVGDFNGFEDFDNGKGLMDADRFMQLKGRKGHFVGGDIIKPHLLTTAIGHARVAAESIDAYVNGLEVGRRPKVDVVFFDMMRTLEERGKAPEAMPGPSRGTSLSNQAVHNYEDRSFSEVIPHDELFLGHFAHEARNRREEVHIGADEVLGHFEERIKGLTDEIVQDEAKRCMSCGICFECDNCIIFCPQVAVFKVKRSDVTMGRYVDTDYSKCIGCHICADVCPTGYIQMGLGE